MDKRTEALIDNLSSEALKLEISDEERRNEIINESMVEVDEDLKLSKVLINHCIPQTQMAELCGWNSVNTFKKHEDEWREQGVISDALKVAGKWAYSPFHIHKILEHIGRSKWSDHDRGTHIINVQNQKGGTGKSTLVINTSQALALDHNERLKILIVDLDPQGSLRTYASPRTYEQPGLDIPTAVDVMLGGEESEGPDSLYENFRKYGFTHEEIIQEAILDTELPNLQIMTAFPEDERFSANAWKEDTESKVKLLKERIIDKIRDDYDIIFIDSGPQVNPLTWSALYASNGLLTPVTPQSLDWFSTKQYLGKIPHLVKQLPEGAEGLKWLKIAITNYDSRNNRDEVVANRIKDEYGSRVFNDYVEKFHAFEVATRNFRTVMDIKESEKLVPKGQATNAQSTVKKFSQTLLRHLKDQDVK